MLNKLDEFKGYTADSRLKEFRKLIPDKTFKIISFNTPKGREMLNEYEKRRKKQMTMETPKENTEVKAEPKAEEAKVEIIADGKVITPKKEDLRINIMLKDGHIFIGAQANDTDPKMTTLQGDLTAALARIPSFVEESNEAWDVKAHNPKSTVPEPKPPVTTTRTATTSSKSASKPAAPPAQKAFF